MSVTEEGDAPSLVLTVVGMEVDGLAAFGMEDVMVRVSLSGPLSVSQLGGSSCGAGLDSLSERSRKQTGGRPLGQHAALGASRRHQRRLQPVARDV